MSSSSISSQKPSGGGGTTTGTGNHGHKKKQVFSKEYLELSKQRQQLQAQKAAEAAAMATVSNSSSQQHEKNKDRSTNNSSDRSWLDMVWGLIGSPVTPNNKSSNPNKPQKTTTAPKAVSDEKKSSSTGIKNNKSGGSSSLQKSHSNQSLDSLATTSSTTGSAGGDKDNGGARSRSNSTSSTISTISSLNAVGSVNTLPTSTDSGNGSSDDNSGRSSGSSQSGSHPTRNTPIPTTSEPPPVSLITAVTSVRVNTRFLLILLFTTLSVIAYVLYISPIIDTTLQQYYSDTSHYTIMSARTHKAVMTKGKGKDKGIASVSLAAAGSMIPVTELLEYQTKTNEFYSYRRGYYYYPRKQKKHTIPPFLSIAITHPRPLFPVPNDKKAIDADEGLVVFPPLANDYISWDIKGQELYMISQPEAYEDFSLTKDSDILAILKDSPYQTRCLKTTLQLMHGYSTEMYTYATDQLEYYVALPIVNGGSVLTLQGRIFDAFSDFPRNITQTYFAEVVANVGTCFLPKPFVPPAPSSAQAKAGPTLLDSVKEFIPISLTNVEVTSTSLFYFMSSEGMENATESAKIAESATVPPVQQQTPQQRQTGQQLLEEQQEQQFQQKIQAMQEARKTVPQSVQQFASSASVSQTQTPPQTQQQNIPQTQQPIVDNTPTSMPLLRRAATGGLAPNAPTGVETAASATATTSAQQASTMNVASTASAPTAATTASSTATNTVNTPRNTGVPSEPSLREKIASASHAAAAASNVAKQTDQEQTPTESAEETDRNIFQDFQRGMQIFTPKIDTILPVTDLETQTSSTKLTFAIPPIFYYMLPHTTIEMNINGAVYDITEIMKADGDLIQENRKECERVVYNLITAAIAASAAQGQQGEQYQLNEVELSMFLARYFAFQVPLDIFPSGYTVLDIDLRELGAHKDYSIALNLIITVIGEWKPTGAIAADGTSEGMCDFSLNASNAPEKQDEGHQHGCVQKYVVGNDAVRFSVE